MNTHDELEGVLNAHEQMLSIIDVDVKFSLECVVDHDTCLNANFVIFGVPVCFVSNWHSVPSIWIQMSESFTDTSDDSLSENMWLLVQMVMISIWVIKSSDWLNHHEWFDLWLICCPQELFVLDDNSFQHFIIII